MGKRGPKKGAHWRQTRTKRRAGALAKLLKQKELADERWAEELLRIALQDVRDFYDQDGNLIPVTAWTADQGKLVAGVEVVIKNAQAGDGHTDRVLKLKHWDKLRALELWGKYRSLLVEKHEHDVTLHADLFARLDAGRQRARTHAARQP